jgi:hypothetical protein
MRLLSVRFAPRSRREPLGLDKDTITFAGPVEENRFGFRDVLLEIMDALRGATRDSDRVRLQPRPGPTGGVSVVH